MGVPSNVTRYRPPERVIDESERPGGKFGATMETIGLPVEKYVAASKATFLYPRFSVAYNCGIIGVVNNTVSANENVITELPDTLIPPP